MPAGRAPKSLRRLPLVRKLGLDHRGFDIAMGRQFLNRSYTIAAFEHVWRKEIPEFVLYEQGPRHGVLGAFCASNPNYDGGLIAVLMLIQQCVSP